MIACALIAATLVVQPPTVKTVPSAILGRDVKFEDIETLTRKAKCGKTRFMCNGSGFFVSPDGDVLTNHHVIDGAEEIVAVWKGVAYRMHVAAVDKDHDLALLKLDVVPVAIDKDIDFAEYERPEFPPLCIDADVSCDVGETIYVVGYPQIAYQGLEAKVTRGIISSMSGFKGQDDNFQMDAAIQGGNSGGPVVDGEGRLVGVTVATLRGGQNVNYAIKLNVVEGFVSQNNPRGTSRRVVQRGRKMIKSVVESSVLVLSYENGSRPLRFDDATKSVRENNERRAIFKQTVVYAKLLKVRREWSDLKSLTDSMLKEYGESAGEDIVELNKIAKQELEKADNDKRKETEK